MTPFQRKVSLAAALAVALNAAAGAFTWISAETGTCPSPAPKCSDAYSCESQQGGCTICYPNPVGPVCTTKN